LDHSVINIVDPGVRLSVPFGHGETAQGRRKTGVDILKSIAMRIGLAVAVSLVLIGLSTVVPVEARGGHGGGGHHFAKNHPRRAEVLHRDRHLARRMNKDRGHLGGHYNQLQREDRKIHRQERREARANGGHLTGREQKQLNREENHLNRQIKRDRKEGRPNDRFDDRHPRRGEVLNRDSRLNGKLNGDYGKLGGHYGQLRKEDRAIRRQEQADARANGGFLTKREQKQLNREENRLNKQIRQDQK
jgi:hypothetical protein